MKRMIFAIGIVFCILHVLHIGGQEPATGMSCERVYLQTDKSLYLAGETVYLKTLTLTDGKIPLSFSRVAYVELVAGTLSLVRLQTALCDGVGQGRMELSPDIPTGYYRLIAYTQWMRNETPEVFFEKQIAVVNTQHPFPPYSAPADSPAIALHSGKLPVDKDPSGDEGCVLCVGKPVYKTREQGILQLTGLSGNIHTLSVSVAGVSSPVPDGNRSDQLRMAVFAPFSPRSSAKKYLPEYEGPILSGKLTPMETADVPATGITAWLAVPGRSIRFFTGKNENDDVRFFTTGIADVTEIVASVADKSGHKYRIDMETPFVLRHPSKPRPELRLDSLCPDDLTKRHVARQVMMAVAAKDDTIAAAEYTCFDLTPAKTYLLEEYTRFSRMEDVVTEFVQGVRFQTGNGKKRLTMAIKQGNDLLWIEPLVTLDGIPLREHDALISLNPLLVEKIDVYPAGYVFGETVFKGILAFSTFRHDCPVLQADSSYRTSRYAWPPTPHPFRAPDYTDESVRRSRQPDFRHTLLWAPDIRPNGRTSLDIPFFTSDFTGAFAVTVEGLTADGRVVHAHAVFRVE